MKKELAESEMDLKKQQRMLQKKVELYDQDKEEMERKWVDFEKEKTKFED